MAQRSSSKDLFHLLAVVVAVVAVCALYFAKVVFVPLALAMLLSFVLTPFVKLLGRARIGRTPATLLTVFLTLAGVGATGWMVARQFAEVLNQLPQYQSNLEEKIGSLAVVRSPAIKNASATMNQLTETLASPTGNGSDTGGDKRAAARAQHPARPLPVEVIKPASLPLESVQSILELALQILIVIIFTVFMLLRRENLRNRFISLAGPQRLSAMTHALDEASERVSRYLRTQLTVNAGYGTIIGAGLHVLGIPGALLWGVVVGVLRFLPYIGPPLGGIMPVLLSMAIFHGWKMPLLTLGMFVVTELTVTYVIEPMVYGAHTGISPLAILVAAIFWTVLWGPIGLVLSTPLTVCLVVLGRHIPHLGFLPLLLGDEPVLTPEVRVYQRLLAGDQEEAEQVLEQLVEVKPLVEVYDTVLIPALNLAEQDRHRDQLDEESERFIYRSAREIIDDLGGRGTDSGQTGLSGLSPGAAFGEERQRHNLKIVCVPARDEADEMVGGMLVQLLTQRGYRAGCVRPGTNAELVERVKFEKPDIVCISALPPFVLSHTRSLYRLLKAQLPELEIIIGLWNFPTDAQKVVERLGIEKGGGAVSTLADMIHLVASPAVGTAHAPLAAPKA
jgi:predicted PurR-regulated permease PerM